MKTPGEWMHAAHRAGLVTFIALAATWIVLPVAAQTLAAGVDHNCTLSSTGGVVCWGSNQYGQVGDGTTITRTAPTNVNLPFGVTSLAGNWGQSCAVTSAGAAKCWGWNDYGQLGDGSKIQRNSPVDVSGLGSGVARISAGYGHTCALTTSGGIKCWGADASPASNNGELGNGANTGSLTPGDVTGFASGAGALWVATGKGFTCAVTAGGGAKCWGANVWDQLGNNDPAFADRNVPVDVFGLNSGVASVATGEIHACALTTSGGVKCWGYAASGALGNNSQLSPTGTQPVAADVTGLTSGVAAITAGTSHTCAMKTTGEVLCWGGNAQGQVGDGTNTQRNTPVSVASGAIAISAGAFHTCILTAVGVSQCWGNNAQGNLGNGTQGGPTYVPVSSTFPASTSTTLVSGANPLGYGDSVTFTATVTGGIEGTAVAFQNGGANIAGCSAQLLVSGTATCVTNALTSGTKSIAAIYQGTATTLASTSSALSQVVNKADQIITFDALADKIDTDPPFVLAASATSALAVAFVSQTTAVCTVSGTTVTLVVAGICTIAADQGGNANYNPALQVTRSFTVISSGPALALLAVKSRKTHGAIGTFDLTINTGIAIGGLIDVEPRAIGIGHKVVFQFNIPITVSGTAAAIDSSAAPIGTATPAINGNEVVVTLTGIQDKKRVAVSLTGVNGTGNFTVALGFYVGDVNNNRFVNTADIIDVKGKSGVVNATTFRYDVNLNGLINTADIIEVKGRSGPLP